MSVLFTDDCNRGDNDALGGSWVERSGGADWDIASNEMTQASINAQQDTFYNTSVSFASADYTVQAAYKPSGNFGGIIGRRVNYSTADSDGYIVFVQGGGGDGYLYRRVSGSYTQLGTYNTAFTTGVQVTLKLSMQGTTIKAYFAGVEQISVTDSSLSAAGDFGGSAYGGQWDDWLVEDFVTGGAAGLLVGGQLIGARVLIGGRLIL